MRIVAVQRGRVAELPYRKQTVRTGFRKLPVTGRQLLTRDGLLGDEQADTVHHGGPDKAVCAYPHEHYPHWTRRLARRELPPAAFGENVTLHGLTEDDVCIGDVFAVGDARLQLSQPRRPCYKLAAIYGEPRIVLWVQTSGYTGFYFRVIDEGEIWPGAELVLEGRPHPSLTVTEANRVMHRDKHDGEGIERLLVPELADSWRQTLSRRLAGAPRVTSTGPETPRRQANPPRGGAT